MLFTILFWIRAYCSAPFPVRSGCQLELAFSTHSCVLQATQMMMALPESQYWCHFFTEDSNSENYCLPSLHLLFSCFFLIDINFQWVYSFRHYLHVYFCTMDLLSYCFDDANDNILQTFSFRIVMQNESLPLLCIRASEGRGSHTRVNCSKVVMQSIQVLEGEIKNMIIRHSLTIYEESKHIFCPIWTSPFFYCSYFYTFALFSVELPSQQAFQVAQNVLSTMATFEQWMA